jgi:hypothetical protein
MLRSQPPVPPPPNPQSSLRRNAFGAAASATIPFPRSGRRRRQGLLPKYQGFAAVFKVSPQSPPFRFLVMRSLHRHLTQLCCSIFICVDVVCTADRMSKLQAPAAPLLCLLDASRHSYRRRRQRFCCRCQRRLDHVVSCACNQAAVFVLHRKSDSTSRCQRCRHGGHLVHMMQWFETETHCPVYGCNCSCHSFDKSAALVCLPASSTSS